MVEGVRKARRRALGVLRGESVGEELQPDQHRGEDEDEQQDGDVRHVFQGRKHHRQKLLKVGPQVGQLEDADQSEDTQGCDCA